MVDFKFFYKFSCSCKRISFDDNSQLIIVTLGWLTSMLLIFKALISIAKFFGLPLHVHSFLSQGLVGLELFEAEGLGYLFQ